MSKIEREMIAEARAARQRQEAAEIGAERCNVCGCSGAQTVSLLPHAAGGYRCVNCDIADHIGADVPSAPNVEQIEAQIEHWWQYAHVLGHVPPLCREDTDGQG